MIIVPFIPAHLENFELQQAQNWINPHLRLASFADSLTALGPAYTALEDGKVLGMSGLAFITAGRAQAWVLVGKDSSRYFLGATRHTLGYLKEYDVRRIETTVRTDFPQGHRWAKILGFHREGTMRAWGEDGLDYDLYARIKNG